MKKTVIILAAAILIVGLTPVTAFAHGHSKSNAATTKYSVCSVQGCTKTKNHKHNGKICLPHNSNDGHSYHNSSSGGSHHH